MAELRPVRHQSGLTHSCSLIVQVLDPVSSKMGEGARGFSGGSVVKNLRDDARHSSSIPYPGRSHVPEKLSWIFPQLNKAHL